MLVSPRVLKFLTCLPYFGIISSEALLINLQILLVDNSIEGIIFVQLDEIEEGVRGHSVRSYTNICR